MASRSWRMQTAVKVFVIEPIRYACAGVASSPRSASASPSARRQSISPSRNAAALTDGIRCSACALARSRSSRSTSVSGGGTEPERGRRQLDRSADRLVVHVEMRDGADDRRVDGRREPDAHVAQPRNRLVAAQPERADVELDEVRLDLVESTGMPAASALRQPPCACVVVREALDMVIERVDARAATIPACRIAAPKRCFSRHARSTRRRSGEQRAERAAETLREADGDRVEQPADLRRGNTGRDGGVHDPRAVECVRRPRSRAAVVGAASSASGQQRPPTSCGCSRARARWRAGRLPSCSARSPRRAPRRRSARAAR